MNKQEIHLIWNPESGIVDLEVDPERLSASEIPGIKAVWSDQRERLQGTAQLHEFTEKLSREWAIETGVIENLYEIECGVTQTLIEQGFQAELLSHNSTNKPREYVLDLLRDQKNALEGIFDFVKSNRDLSASYIKELHAALLRSQDTTEGVDAQGRHVQVDLIKGAWKKQANYPVRDGVTYNYCPPEHVDSEMERLIQIHNQHVQKDMSSEVQAAWLHHRFTQIHPFQDGNGRVARAIASLVLVKDGLFPLVVTRDHKPKYLDALERADSGDLKPLIDLIVSLQITQYRKATAISEAILAEEDVQAALGGLLKAAGKVAAEKLAALQGVFGLARALEEDLDDRLQALVPEIIAALKRIDGSANTYVERSTSQNNYFYRSQIIENAKNYLNYFADMSEYRSWIALKMDWSRRARLVFAFHGIGKPFNGSLICAPFLEFRDRDEEEEISHLSLRPVTEEGFVFFYNEDADRLLARFTPWREGILKVAIKELTQNL